MNEKITLFWFRRDLRLEDNVGLYHALNNPRKVVPIFIFDTQIVTHLPKNDARVQFIFKQITKLNTILKQQGNGKIAVFKGEPFSIFEALCLKFNIAAVYANHDYEPYAIGRDAQIARFLKGKGIAFKTYKDQVIFEKDEVVKSDFKPYTIYTPYKNRWKTLFNPTTHIIDYKISNLLDRIGALENHTNPTLKGLGFKPSNIQVEDFTLHTDLIQNYEATRNFPSTLLGTSKLGPHLRFGTVSIRKIVTRAIAVKEDTFLNELIWREFFMQILWHFPQTVSKAFKPKYDMVIWRNDPDDFEHWKAGETGYPMVDAGMRELNATGYMHNRVRMITASFLCKHLLIDWRWGEAYFAEKLLDFELASNVGNWQWAAGSGVDAAPYFRIFNPTTQLEKFDKDHAYIRKWVPEFQGFKYPSPIVEHKQARERCLIAYKKALEKV